MLRKILLLNLFLFALWSVFAQDHQKMEVLLKQHQVPALGLGLIENGKLTKVQVFGTLDQEHTAPYNTIFKVASLTKPIFTMTVLKLVENGQWDLDEPLHPYWVDPEIASDDRHQKLTARIVLSHRTGFPNWRYLREDNKLAFEFEPGTKYQYSGEGFEYLRKAIENKLDKPLEEISKELIFIPAGMSDTRFWWDKGMDESRYAQNFDKEGKQIKTIKYYEANAAANLLTTVEDYGNFLAYVINGAGLSEELYQELSREQMESKKGDQAKENGHFGLGWEVMTQLSNDEMALLHSGKDPGVSTLAVMFPKSKNGYVIFLNGDNMFPIYEELLTNWVYLGSELWDRK